jgi:D-erythronate 2-dehydrogenase
VVNVVITGGAGFLGSRLARELLAAGSLDVAGGGARPLSGMTLIDQAPVPPDLAADERVTAIQGDLAQLLDPLASGPGTLSGADVIFHLAAAVSGECETDFDLGIRANLRATEALLACCRALGTSPVVVFSSSLAVFGGSEDLPLPEVVNATARRKPWASSCWPITPGKDSCAAAPCAWSASACARDGPTPRRPASCPASSGSRWPGSALSAR